MAREVVVEFDIVALVAKSSLVVNPVDDAYGNCEARRVDDEKKTPWVHIDVDVAEVVVPKLVATEKRPPKLDVLASVAQPNVPLDQVRY
jgi:hypothetical protein